MNHLKILSCIVLWLLSSHNTRAEEIIGYVKTLNPKAFLVKDNRTEEAKVGSPIYAGWVIKTDANGSLGLSLKDNTVLSFGPDTEFEVSHFLFQPAENQLQLHMRLLKGTLQYISGVIAKLKPDNVKLKTPAGIIGVRGTRFVIKVEE